MEWIGLAVIILLIFFLEDRPRRSKGYQPKEPSTPPGPPPKAPSSVSRREED